MNSCYRKLAMILLIEKWIWIFLSWKKVLFIAKPFSIDTSRSNHFVYLWEMIMLFTFSYKLLHFRFILILNGQA